MTYQTSLIKNELNFVDKQPCVIAVRNSRLSRELKIEMEKFISRNTLPDCGRVPPNCFKAHLIKTAKKIGLKERTINKIKNLFKAKIGYDGYYLDKGNLRKA